MSQTAQSPTLSPTPLTWAPTSLIPQHGAEHASLKGRCWDYKDWRSSTGMNCTIYENNALCTIGGKPGLGWTDWLNIEEYATGGNHAFMACCACGGGIPEFAASPATESGGTIIFVVVFVTIIFILLIVAFLIKHHKNKKTDDKEVRESLNEA